MIWTWKGRLRNNRYWRQKVKYWEDRYDQLDACHDTLGDNYGILYDRVVELERELYAARRNDTPNDPATGKFTSTKPKGSPPGTKG